jgi:hypothetical protein
VWRSVLLAFSSGSLRRRVSHCRYCVGVYGSVSSLHR